MACFFFFNSYLVWCCENRQRYKKNRHVTLESRFNPLQSDLIDLYPCDNADTNALHLKVSTTTKVTHAFSDLFFNFRIRIRAEVKTLIVVLILINCGT